MDRTVSGPHPAVPGSDRRGVPVPGPSGKAVLTLPYGEPVWAGQNREACEKLLNDIGPRAFEIECLHRIARLAGSVFRREWFPVVTDWPRGAPRVRYWDFAATEVAEGARRGKDPDWTVGLLLAAWQGNSVLDVQRARLSPHG
jgi:hypothetical protein